MTPQIPVSFWWDVTGIFKEGDAYVALSPELNVSSFGDTIDEAKRSITEAIDMTTAEMTREHYFELLDGVK